MAQKRKEYEYKVPTTGSRIVVEARGKRMAVAKILIRMGDVTPETRQAVRKALGIGAPRRNYWER